MVELSCQRFADLLGDYVDGALADVDRDAMEAHCVACESCRAFVADYERVPGVVRKATDVSMPSEAKARLRRLLSRAWRHRN